MRRRVRSGCVARPARPRPGRSRADRPGGSTVEYGRFPAGRRDRRDGPGPRGASSSRQRIGSARARPKRTSTSTSEAKAAERIRRAGRAGLDGGADGQNAPLVLPEGLVDGAALQLRVAGDIDGGEQEGAAFDRHDAQDMTAHHGGREGQCGEGGDAAAAGGGVGVGGAHRTGDRGGEVVVVEPHHHPYPGVYLARGHHDVEVLPVVTGEHQQRPALPDPGAVQDAGGPGVLQQQRYAQFAGEGNPARVRIAFYDHHLVRGGAELRQHPSTDLAETDEHDVVAKILGRRMPDGRLAECLGGVHGRGHHERQHGQPYETGNELEHPAGRGLVSRRVTHGEDVQQRQVHRLPQRTGLGKGGGHGQYQHDRGQRAEDREDLAGEEHLPRQVRQPVAQPGPVAAPVTRRWLGPMVVGDLFQHQPAVGELPVVGGDRVGQQLGALLPRRLRTVLARRVVLVSAGQYRQCGQVGGLRRGPGGAYDPAEDLTLDLQGVSPADRGGGHQLRDCGVGVGEHGGGHVQRCAAGPAERQYGPVQEPFEVLTALSVVHPDDQADRRVESAGQQGCRDIDLVVAVGESERGGALHPRRAQRLLVRTGGHQQLDR